MPLARTNDPLTSHAAAESISEETITATQEFILKALNRPRTDVDLVEAYRQFKLAPRATEQSIRSRRAELVRKGLVKDSGERIKLASGRYAIVWTAA